MWLLPPLSVFCNGGERFFTESHERPALSELYGHGVIYALRLGGLLKRHDAGQGHACFNSIDRFHHLWNTSAMASNNPYSKRQLDRAMFRPTLEGIGARDFSYTRAGNAYHMSFRLDETQY